MQMAYGKIFALHVSIVNIGSKNNPCINSSNDSMCNVCPFYNTVCNVITFVIPISSYFKVDITY